MTARSVKFPDLDDDAWLDIDTGDGDQTAIVIIESGAVTATAKTEMRAIEPITEE